MKLRNITINNKKEKTMTDISKYKSVALSHEACNKLDKIRKIIVPEIHVSRAKDIRYTKSTRK